MTFDVCIATYNSQKWLRGCVAALAALKYDLSAVSVYFADNASTDGTVTVLEELRAEYGGRFANFTVMQQGGNTGFGAASNAAARAGSGEFVFFLNPDTEIDPEALTELEALIAVSKPKFAGFELRQFPYEHPKYYNPATLETSWCSGACFVLRRELFAMTGGFDETMFLYAEDVELSWRIRTLGYKLRYVPGAVVKHYAYTEPGEEKPAQVAGSLVGNLVLRCKYGTEEDIAWWDEYFEKHQDEIYALPGAKEIVKQGLKRVKKHKRAYRAFYHDVVRESLIFKRGFKELDYEFARAGAFYENRRPKTAPRFSVVVRTYRRPDLLALTLESLRYQTYKNFEVLVVEDGGAGEAAETVEKLKGKLDIQYISAGKHVGRCVAGNMGLEAAQGDYLCFLDDDDYFYPEHLEVMACMIEDAPESRLYVTGALEAGVEALNQRGTRWKVVEKANIAHKKITFATLCYGNPFPIQAAVFHKSLIRQAGVLAPEMDAFEDWDLWIRYGMHTPVACVEKTTSLYKVPAGEKSFARREKVLAEYRKKLYERAANYSATVSAQDILALIYTPEKAQQYEDAGQNAIDYLAYKDKLAETAAEIASSRIWRAGAPLRALPRALAALCGGLGGIFRRLARATAHMADNVGPKVPDIEKKDPAELNDFIFKSRKSVSWRFGSFLAGIKNKPDT